MFEERGTMARNKHPEETVNFILDVAFRLFMEKGYEYTSIQDIIDQLGGLSKGAIYHHFKSKEDILVAVTDRMTAESNQMLADIRDRTDLCGREKLRTIFKSSINRPVQNDIFTVAPDFHNNPRLLFSLLHDTIEEAAPNYILPIIEQGIADGSIETDYPKQLAELILLAANVWMNPMIFDSTVEESCRKFMIFGQMLRGFGLDIVDDEMLARLRELTSIYQRNR
jgi:AcrR family transcriptional regulator